MVAKASPTTRFPARARVLLILLVVGLAMLSSIVASKGWFGSGASAGSEVRLQELPVEAHQTLRMIRAGGPFPYAKDGTVFGNREQRLPKQARGYYTEYTVRTPGSKDRGARRIVVGGPPAQSSELYYTDDHYQSFRRIRE
jgi:ribonuclease T1